MDTIDRFRNVFILMDVSSGNGQLGTFFVNGEQTHSPFTTNVPN